VRCNPLLRHCLAVGLAAAAVWSSPPPLSSQQTEPILSAITLPETFEAPRTQPADSVRVLSGARSAQSRFEFIRRNNLPWTWSRGGGPCDERIGRFCLWYGTGESTWEPPPDPEAVKRARSTLIARLDTAAAMIPGDWWVAGQRVRYLIEAERPEDAVAAATACRSDSAGWCDALLGYALHEAGEYVRADSAFSVALAAMPERQRRRWTDLSPLLPADALRAYRRLDDAEREAFEARFWWLANPLYSLPGNDRRTEHFSRHVIDRLQDRARQTEGIAWGADLRELLLRYGAPAGWERVRARLPQLGSSSMVTRYAPGSRHFDPPLPYLERLHEIEPDSWDLNPRRARTSYAPAYSQPMEEPEYQVAVFQRDDSAVVVAALQLAPDSAGIRHAAEATLVLTADENNAPALQRQPITETPAILNLSVPAVPLLISVEAFAAEARRAARARYGLELGPLPTHGLAVSDLLLLDAPDALPDSLDSAIPLARASTHARSGERLGVFWEIYGLSPADLPVEVAVHLIDENAGWLRRTAVRAGFLRQEAPLTVRWREAPAESPAVFPRSLAIELPELSPGTYSLQLTLTPRGREPLQATREIAILE
jgi:hypothetical protein